MDGHIAKAVFSTTIATLLLGAMPALADWERFHRSVPEFDPTTVFAIVAIMVDGGALLTRHRRSARPPAFDIASG
jgi:hypothetical protein